MLTNIYADEMNKLLKDIKNVDLEEKSDVLDFVKKYTELIYNYNMVGLIYDYYKEDVEVLKENKLRLKGVDAVVKDILQLQAAFPDLKVSIENTIIYGNAQEGYKVYRRMKYKGTNTGYSRYGVATGRKLGNNCLALSIFYIRNIDGRWKITNEIEMRSAGLINCR